MRDKMKHFPLAAFLLFCGKALYFHDLASVAGFLTASAVYAYSLYIQEKHQRKLVEAELEELRALKQELKAEMVSLEGRVKENIDHITGKMSHITMTSIRK